MLYFSIFYQLTSYFLPEINLLLSIQWESLEEQAISFSNFFRISQILKIDGAKPIVMRGYGVKVTIFLTY